MARKSTRSIFSLFVAFSLFLFSCFFVLFRFFPYYIVCMLFENYTQRYPYVMMWVQYVQTHCSTAYWLTDSVVDLFTFWNENCCDFWMTFSVFNRLNKNRDINSILASMVDSYVRQYACVVEMIRKRPLLLLYVFMPWMQLLLISWVRVKCCSPENVSFLRVKLYSKAFVIRTPSFMQFHTIDTSFSIQSFRWEFDFNNNNYYYHYFL